MNFLAGLLEKIVGGWLTKTLNQLKDWIVQKAKIWWKAREHKKEVDKYVEAIENLTALARAEVEEHGRVTEETEKKLAQMLERRNRGVPFNDDWL